MKNTPLVAIGLSLTALLTGCATIVSKSDWPVTINTTPSSANIKITNSTGHEIYSGATPTTVTLTTKKGYFKGESYKVEISKPGFASTVYEIRPALNGWYIGNLVFGGVIGFLIVDPLTGAMYRFDKDVNVSLNTLSTYIQPDTLSIVSLDRIPENLRGALVKFE